MDLTKCRIKVYRGDDGKCDDYAFSTAYIEGYYREIKSIRFDEDDMSSFL